jgi:hypothetical protein
MKKYLLVSAFLLMNVCALYYLYTQVTEQTQITSTMATMSTTASTTVNNERTAQSWQFSDLTPSEKP